MNTPHPDAAVHLKSGVKLEPLFHRWYAWSHLVSPVQQAINLAFRQIPLLRSFIANPNVHIAASKNPQMLGGPFLELPASDLPAVRRLLQDTLKDAAPLLRFAEDLQKLNRQLQQTASGHSLDAVYAELPPTLAGLIEVSYDLNHHPGLRVLDPLLSYPDAADADRQALAFSTERDEQRHFFLNTPRLDGDARLVLPLPFAAPHHEALAASRIRAVPYAELKQALKVPEEQEARFRGFFDTEAPQRNQPEYHGGDVRIRYFGHACVLLQTASTSVLIDPFVTWDRDGEPQRLTFDDLPDHIDYVFITHNHQDHFSPELLLQLRGRIGRLLVPRHNSRSLADPSMKLTLRALGFRNVSELEPMESVRFDDGEIVSLPFYGEHADLDIESKHGMFLRLKNRRFLFLADSDCKDRALYRRIVERLGKADTLFIGMECDGAPLSWLYGPYTGSPLSRRDDESRTLSGSDCEHAWSIVEEFDCKKIYVYAMGQEPWMRFVTGLEYSADSKQIVESNKFLERCRAAGLSAERLYGCSSFSC
ncbi:MBL fold metallo-hydrolase [Chromobacterium haemolyticum]|uniref:MBL fold metallo-hydrolase n=1 Tax=Chromobacterium haemolyticum TaxID=394935 RepID=UPI0009D9AA8A|nr:MBL fold metallo-hydrolase [Chromobacterium haemolyticum]OQS36951.1 hypothetical protein B0T39_16060 [Chromobacterium haemolyticum]